MSSLPPEQPHVRSPSGELNYKGVPQRKSGRSWVSEIRLPNSRKRIWLGSYDTPEKAARAFDAAFVCLRSPGGTDRLNFPSSPPDVGPTSDRKEVRAAALSHANQSAAGEEAATESPSANDDGVPMERVATVSRAVLQVSPESFDDWLQVVANLRPPFSPHRMGSPYYFLVSPTAAAAHDDMEENESGWWYELWTFDSGESSSRH